MDKEHIIVLYKLNPEELSYILNRYTTKYILDKRTQAREKLGEKFCYNMMGLPKKQQKDKDDEKVLTMEEALALFE